MQSRRLPTKVSLELEKQDRATLVKKGGKGTPGR